MIKFLTNKQENMYLIFLQKLLLNKIKKSQDSLF